MNAFHIFLLVISMACYVSVSGGFGNQLFCYALGRHLELSRRCDVLYDISFYHKPQSVAHNRLWLDQLGLPFKSTLLNGHHYNLLRKTKFLSVKGQQLLFGEAYLKYKPTERTPVPRRADGVFFTGCWHDISCFEGSADVVRKELLEVIGAERPSGDPGVTKVAVHVRRGDYVAHKSSAKIDYVALLKRGRAVLRERLPGAPLQFIIFSDDMPWCKEHLAGEDVVYSQCGTMIDDFRMMLGCTHYIIANSTFSWWAAFLNPAPEKIVLLPSRWYAKLTAAESGLVDKGWIAIDGV